MTLTLQPGPFANNVYLHPPASMHELKLRAADYVRMEEMQTLHTKLCNDYAATSANPTPQAPWPILVSNTYLFAWSAADLPRVDPLVASHKLSIYKEARYISQKKNANSAKNDA